MYEEIHEKILSFLLVLALFTSITACSQSNVQDDIHSESGNAGEMISVDCTAVVNGDVYQLPSKAEAWDSSVPSGILGSIWLANVLHADNVSEAECVARINEYYETFYNFTYSEN